MSGRRPLAAPGPSVASSGPQETEARATDARGAVPCADDAMTRPVEGPRPPKKPPWKTLQSAAAGLPALKHGEEGDEAAEARVRAEWVRIVLDAILDPRATSHVKAAAVLGERGYVIRSSAPDKAVRQWHAWLALELRRGRLPELKARGLSKLPAREPGRRDAPAQGPDGKFGRAAPLAPAPAE